MKRFRVGKLYQNIRWNGFEYVKDGYIQLLSRLPEVRTNKRGFKFDRWPAIVNGKKTYVDLQEDEALDSETIHEISPLTGEWKKGTCRYGVKELFEDEK